MVPNVEEQDAHGESESNSGDSDHDDLHTPGHLPEGKGEGHSDDGKDHVIVCSISNGTGFVIFLSHFASEDREDSSEDHPRSLEGEEDGPPGTVLGFTERGSCIVHHCHHDDLGGIDAGPDNQIDDFKRQIDGKQFENEEGSVICLLELGRIGPYSVESPCFDEQATVYETEGNSKEPGEDQAQVVGMLWKHRSCCYVTQKNSNNNNCTIERTVLREVAPEKSQHDHTEYSNEESDSNDGSNSSSNSSVVAVVLPMDITGIRTRCITNWISSTRALSTVESSSIIINTNSELITSSVYQSSFSIALIEILTIVSLLNSTSGAVPAFKRPRCVMTLHDGITRIAITFVDIKTSSKASASVTSRAWATIVLEGEVNANSEGVAFVNVGRALINRIVNSTWRAILRAGGAILGESRAEVITTCIDEGAAAAD